MRMQTFNSLPAEGAVQVNDRVLVGADLIDWLIM